jgi:hypothetical protein
MVPQTKKGTVILNNPSGIRTKCICSTKIFYLAHNTTAFEPAVLGELKL